MASRITLSHGPPAYAGLDPVFRVHMSFYHACQCHCAAVRSSRNHGRYDQLTVLVSLVPSLFEPDVTSMSSGINVFAVLLGTIHILRSPNHRCSASLSCLGPVCRCVSVFFRLCVRTPLSHSAVIWAQIAPAVSQRWTLHLFVHENTSCIFHPSHSSFCLFLDSVSNNVCLLVIDCI